MKILDVVCAILVVVGALNWGLVGLLEYNLVDQIFGTMNILSRIVYTIVGIAGLYQVVFLRSIHSRWGVHS